MMIVWRRIKSKLKLVKPETVVYYYEYRRLYSQLIGTVKKIDSYWKSLQLGNVRIGFEEIYDVIV